MDYQFKKHLVFLPILALVGCSHPFANSNSNNNTCIDETGRTYNCGSIGIGAHSSAKTSSAGLYDMHSEAQDPTLFRTNINFQLLNEYIQQMSKELNDSLIQRNIKQPIAITSFVNLDSTLRQTNALGNQISEYFLTELPKLGLPISDHKITGNIAVTQKGDFAFSRNIEDLKKQQNIGYILSGTMINNDKGVIINARVIALETNTVVASSNKLIPSLIVKQVI